MAEIALIKTKTLKVHQVERIMLGGVATGTAALDFTFDASAAVTGNKVSVTPVIGDTAAILAGKLATALTAEDGVTDKFETITHVEGDEYVMLQYNTYTLFDAITLADTVGISATSVITNAGVTEVLDKDFIRYDQIARVEIKKIGDKYTVVAVLEGCIEGQDMVLSSSDTLADAFTSFDSLTSSILATDTAAAVAYDLEQ